MPASIIEIEARAEATGVSLFENVGIDYVPGEISFPRCTREGRREQGGGIVTCREDCIWLSKPSIYPSLASPVDRISACRLISQKLNPNLSYDARGLSVIFNPKFKLNQIEIVPHGQGSSVWSAEKIGALHEWDVLGGNSSRPSQTDCENAENNSKCRNDNGRHSNRLLMVGVNEPSGIEEPNFERSVKGGAVFFIGVFCLLGFAAWFWWLITRP